MQMRDYLQQMVERSSAVLLGRGGKTVAEGLLFLGNPQLVFPRLLFEDPILEPVDRNVWAAIKLHAADGDSVTAFPSYEELMLRCNVGSKATISRSISILRATRWLTVCKVRLRDAKGRVRGNVYALHDEPLQLVETMALDAYYLEWMGETAQGNHNPHPRAIAVADKLLRDMQVQLQAGEDITRLESSTARRFQVYGFMESVKTGKPSGAFFSASAQSVQELSRRDYLTAKPSSNHAQVQKLYLVEKDSDALGTETVLGGAQGDEYRNCTAMVGVGTETVRRSNSSKYLNNNTTTTKPIVVNKRDRGLSTESVLAWPAILDPNNRALVKMQLGTVPNQYRQPVLDALAAKLTAIASGTSKPLNYGILPYTRRLCELAVEGKLNPVAVVIPPQHDASHSVPQDSAGIGIELRILEGQLSSLSNEVRHLEQLHQLGASQANGLADARQRWQAATQRYEELKQKQANILS